MSSGGGGRVDLAGGEDRIVFHFFAARPEHLGVERSSPSMTQHCPSSVEPTDGDSAEATGRCATRVTVVGRDEGARSRWVSPCNMSS